MSNLIPEQISAEVFEPTYESGNEVVASDPDIAQEYFLLEELSPELRRKVELIKAILEASDRATKQRCIDAAASELKKSEKTICRYRNLLRNDGVFALTRTERSDKGSTRYISSAWLDLVVELFKRWHRQGRRDSRHHLWLCVQGLVHTLDTNGYDTPEKRQFLIDWYATKLGTSEESKKSKINKILSRIRKELEEGIVRPPRSHMAIYKAIDIHLEKESSYVRSPGQGPDKYVVTTEGKLPYKYTNDLFQADHTGLDLLLVDKDGNEIGYPFLTVIIDCASRCIVGFYLGFHQPSSHEVALALRHAILPKEYGPEYNLKHGWNCRGLPRYLMTDRAKEFKSQHLKQISSELGIELRYRAYPSQGGIVESVFDKINKEVLSSFPGYKGSNVQKRPKNAQKRACLTVEEFEKDLVRFFCDHYNWHDHSETKVEGKTSLDVEIEVRTRSEKWNLKLTEPPRIPDERQLDLCLYKQEFNIKVQKHGTINFLREIYFGDCLLGLGGERINLRYDPSNIIHILAYTEEEVDAPSKFLGVLKNRDRKEEKLSLHSLKLERKKILKSGKEIDRSSIFMDALDRNELSEKKSRENRKQKRHKEHERAGCSDGLTNLLEFKSQEVKDDSKAAYKPTKRLVPKQPAKVFAENWNKQLDDEW